MPTDNGGLGSVDEITTEGPPAKEPAKASRRVVVDLPVASFERLKKLKETSEATSFTEVIKNAMRLYEYLIEKDIAGARFLVGEAGKPPVEVKLFS